MKRFSIESLGKGILSDTYRTTDEKLAGAFEAAGIDPTATYRITGGGFQGMILTIDVCASYVSSDGSLQIVSLNGTQQVARSSAAEFLSLTEKVTR